MVLKGLQKASLAVVVLTTMLAACDSNQTPILNENETVNALQDKSNNTFAFKPTDILSMVKDVTIQETDWGTQVSKLPILRAKKKATVLSYLAFDNDKGGYRDELRPMINFHELSGTSDVMNMAIQTDGADDKDLKRYLIHGDLNKDKIVSPYVSFKYERDSADYRVLQAFAKWGFSTYPGDIKLLDIDNHGGAFLGIAKDDTSGKLISLPNLNKAIKNAVGKVDILNFDACLMGTIESIYELRDSANYMIGSEDSTLGTGMMYTKALPAIIQKAQNPEQLAAEIVLASDRKGIDFMRRPNRKGKVPNVFTIAAFRASAVQGLVTEINTLSKMILSNINGYKPQMKSVFAGTKPFHIDEDELGGQRDLHEILKRMSLIITDGNIKAQVGKTTNALNKTIIIARSHNTEKQAQGMAINISPEALASQDYQNNSFAKVSSWDEMVIAVSK